MKYVLQQNLGMDDARHCNDQFQAGLSLKAVDLAQGSVVDLNEQAVAYLTERKSYVALLGPIGKVQSEAKKPEITAPAK